MNATPRSAYETTCKTIARAAALIAVAAAVQARARRGMVDAAPLLARAVALLARIDPQEGSSEHAKFVRTLAARDLESGRVERGDSERYESALRWARGWPHRASRRARAAASRDDRRRELRRRVRDVSLRATTIVIGILAAMLVAELWLRVHSAGPSRAAELRRAAGALPPPVVDECSVQARQAGLGELVRPSRIHDVVYELKPGIDTCFKGARVTTNEDGQRSPVRYARPRPPDTYRILLLGDSFAFGWAVEYEATFASIIQRELASSSGRSVEVIDASVPGYNTTMEAASYLSTGASYEAQCVMVFFCGNDLAVPHLMAKPASSAWHGSYLLGALRAFGEPRADDQWFRVAEGPLSFSLRDDEADDWVPEEYRHMVGISGYRHAMTELAQTASSKGATVVNIADYKVELRIGQPEEFTAFQRPLGIVLPDFDYPQDDKYKVSDSDEHPNAAGHAEIARRILAGLRATNACLPSPR